MNRFIGRSAYGIRLPLKVNFDKFEDVLVEHIIKAADSKINGFTIPPRGGIIGVTESLVARAQSNYVTKNEIAISVEKKLIPGDIVLLFPILSRNRFLPILKAIAQIERKITIILHAIRDEVGNPLSDNILFWEEKDPLLSTSFEKKYGRHIHPYTKINYIDLYKKVRSENLEIVISDNPNHSCMYGDNIIICTTHSRNDYKSYLTSKYPQKNFFTLSDICTEPINNSGYNAEYGLLGSNMAGESKIKLFPRDCFNFAQNLQNILYERLSKKIEVLVFGDGAYKDPAQQIWELADPVTCPGYTSGLLGVPKELKLKYFLDNDENNSFKNKIEMELGNIDSSNNNSLGTTPRNIVDLVASLCDLITGSGDTGTPVVYINGYFDKFFDDNITNN